MHAYTHVYIIPYFERRYLYIIIYICIYDDIFYNIYTTFTIISLTFGRQRGYHIYEYWSVADTDTRSAPIFWVARFFFPMHGASLRFVLNE